MSTRIRTSVSNTREQERSVPSGERWASQLLYPTTLIVIATVLYLPLLGREGFYTHEGFAPYLRALEYLGEVRAGHWIPQSFPSLFSGAGYAFPRIYPPLGNAIAATLTAASGDVVVGVHFAFLASVILSGLSMYAFLISVTRNRMASMIGAIAYIGFPYRFQDVFVRGALAECWSFVWYPLILLGGWRLQEQRRLPWYLPIAAGALLLSHPQMALYFAVVCAILVLFWRPLPSRGTLVRGVYAVLIALGLTAWYWLPQKHYLPTMRAGVPALVWADVEFVERQRLTPLTVVTGQPERNALNLTVGGLAIGANLLVLGAWLSPKGARQNLLLLRRADWLLVPWWALLVFMIVPGVPLRVLPASFGYIQFPWRLLGPMGFLATSSFALLISAWQSQRVTIGGLCLLLASLISAGVSPNVRSDWTAATLAAKLLPPGPLHGLDGSAEYLPVTIPDVGGDYRKTMDSLSRVLKLGPRSSSSVSVQSYLRSGSSAEVVVDARDSGAVVLPLIYYDFYSASNREGTRLELRDSLGLVAFTAPPGRHLVVLRERLTPLYQAGLSISALTALVCGALILRRQRVRASLGY